jgi:hypothetical protein
VAIIDQNLRLIERGLIALGYRFLNPPPGAPIAGMADAIQNSAAEALLHHPGLSEEQKQQLLASLSGIVGPDAPAASVRPPASTRSSAIGDPAIHAVALDSYRAAQGPLPLLLDAFWRRIGWVDFLGGFEAGPLARLRPLTICPPLAIDDDYDQHLDDADEHDPFYLDLMPDPNSTCADDPLMAVALKEGADLELPDGSWLLDHIRRAVAGGGFLSPDEAGSRSPAFAAIAATCAPF